MKNPNSPGEIQGTGTDLYSQFIHKSRYSRWLEEKGRRETWKETTQRYMDFWIAQYPELEGEIQPLVEYIRQTQVMPSMRALMSAGPALDRDHVAAYNCAFLAIDHVRSFDEMMYILMCGTGVGFSVERQHINKLPAISEDFHDTDTTVIVHDSKIGWAKAFRELLSLLYNGQVPRWDVSQVREKGARLVTFGGRASGPEPLERLFRFTIQVFKRASGRKLTSIEVHDICCKIAEIVVSGGVRRSATISLSNLSDDRMRGAKSGQWWNENPQRRLANNSACLSERPDFNVFLSEWLSLHASKSGERGFFSLAAARKQAARWGKRDPDLIMGTNPCAEIILRNRGFCNLSEVVVRPEDTIEELREKIRVATIFGTLQSSLTKFRYIRKSWRKNAEEERLLGVSLTGIMDHSVLGDAANPDLPRILDELRSYSVEVNEEWAGKLGIDPSVAITCVKPSGTVSQLCNTASGIHPRFSDYYIRRVRIDRKDPIGQFMEERGFPCEPENVNPDVMVFSFPIENPIKDRPTAGTLGGMGQLDLWMLYHEHWCHHKPSCTVYYTDDEFLEIGQWLWDNLDRCSGVSFLPYSDHIYDQAPYETIDQFTYESLKKRLPDSVDWKEMVLYEQEDHTVGSQTLACTGNVCEIVDLTSGESFKTA